MRFLSVATSIALLLSTSNVSQTAETPQEKQAVLSALQGFNDFIGAWSGNGESKTGKTEFWKEKMSWGWKFNKNAAATLSVEFKDNKQFTKGELKYAPDKKIFQLAVVGADKKEQVFEGKMKGKALELARTDDTTKDKYTIRMSSTNEGALFNLDYMVQTGGKGIDKKLFTVQSKKDGVSISGGKKNECVVSGGVGTIPVSYNGKTYYVCCGGCRDAFNESEAAKKKIVEDFEKKNKK